MLESEDLSDEEAVVTRPAHVDRARDDPPDGVGEEPRIVVADIDPVPKGDRRDAPCEVLSEAEHEAIALHPLVGYQMLVSLRVEPVATWVLHHHERYDGNGYPDGLAADEIPIGSRILLVADAYEAMTTDRLYRATRSSDDALTEIKRCAGTQFDPLVVDALALVVAQVAASATL